MNEQQLSEYRALVVGGIWMPYGATASMEYKFRAEDTEDAEDRVPMEAGDFSSVEDFELSELREVCSHCHKRGWVVVRPFTEDGEIMYWDTLPQN